MNGESNAFKKAQREADMSRTSGQVTRKMGTKAVSGLSGSVPNRTRSMPLKISSHANVKGANV